MEAAAGDEAAADSAAPRLPAPAGRANAPRRARMRRQVRSGCTAGYFCEAGASAPLPCPGGSWMRLVVCLIMKSDSDCAVCGRGTFCPVGSESAILCAAGTCNARERRRECNKCAAGRFQEAEGATACVECTPGYYCKEGAAAALP